MGLDSVELVVRIEKYFGIQIPDDQAEILRTIQNMVDAVADHLKIVDTSTELRERVFNKVKTALNQDAPIELNDPVSKHIPFDKEKWKILKNTLQLKTPVPGFKYEGSKNWWEKTINHFTLEPMYDPNTLIMENLVDAICMHNYDTLVDNKNIKSKYEIYIAVSGLTVDQSGVDNYEIQPDKSFTNDLGID